MGNGDGPFLEHEEDFLLFDEFKFAGNDGDEEVKHDDGGDYTTRSQKHPPQRSQLIIFSVHRPYNISRIRVLHLQLPREVPPVREISQRCQKRVAECDPDIWCEIVILIGIRMGDEVKSLGKRQMVHHVDQEEHLHVDDDLDDHTG